MMPDIARRLSIPTITIVPGYWLPESAGKEYEKELMALFNCKPFSYKGFILNNEKPDTCILTEELRKYKENLKSIYSFPYMELSEDEYVEWFSSYYIPVGNPVCSNIERLVDIQPDGSVNFCVDFPDYILGNIQSSSIVEIWNSLNAENFRKYRRKNKLAVCHRCGAKYMSEIMDKV
jgi:MoaA/NifB/PqqE/SkfB family radical SAM enzyme